MTTRPPQQQPDPTAYAKQVRAALSDLPSSTLDELLEDLDDHLADVAAAHGGSLDALGTPAAYAHELRGAAGLAPRASSRRHRLTSLDAKIYDAAVRLSRHDTVRPVLAFLPELRPAWWVLRAWLALLTLDYLLLGSQSFAFPLPGATGLGALLGLPLLAAAVVLSVRLGQRAARDPHTDPRRRTLTIAGNTLAALLAVIAVVAVQERSSQPVYADDAASYPLPISDGMTHPDGTPITNIYPYSSTGEPLTGVLLYDQDGRALDNLSTHTHDGQHISRLVLPGHRRCPATPIPSTSSSWPPTARRCGRRLRPRPPCQPPQHPPPARARPRRKSPRPAPRPPPLRPPLPPPPPRDGTVLRRPSGRPLQWRTQGRGDPQLTAASPASGPGPCDTVGAWRAPTSSARLPISRPVVGPDRVSKDETAASRCDA